MYIASEVQSSRSRYTRRKLFLVTQQPTSGRVFRLRYFPVGVFSSVFQPRGKFSAPLSTYRSGCVDTYVPFSYTYTLYVIHFVNTGRCNNATGPIIALSTIANKTKLLVIKQKTRALSSFKSTGVCTYHNLTNKRSKHHKKIN